MRTKRWEDHFARRARDEKWLARSVYKLEEIDKKFRIIDKGDRVLDLGCCPGSWTQYGLRRVGPKGEVVGIDLTQLGQPLSSNFRFIQADVLALDTEWLIRELAPVDVVISDLAPQTTGIRSADTARSVALAKRAAEIAFLLLKRRGRFVCKVFEGEGLKDLRSETSTHFRHAKLFRPAATRQGSREIYLVGLDFIK